MPDENLVELRCDQRAIDFTNKSLVFDALSLFYVVDEPYTENCLSAGVNACNVSFALENTWDETLRNVETGLNKIEKSPLMMLVTTADDILKAQEMGKLGIILGTQGSSMIETQLTRVGIMEKLGFRFFGLAYTGATLFADGCGENRNAGLSCLGIELIEAVNETPMILDLSHCGHRTRDEAVELARAVVCTHSNAWDLVNNDRNTMDSTAKAIIAKGGMVGVCCLPKTVNPQNPTLGNLVGHVDHYAKVIGVENIGIGLDFTEAYKSSGKILPESRRWRTLRPDIFGTVDEFLTQNYPRGIGGIRELPNVTQELFDRGYKDGEVAGILGANWLRTFKKFVG
jgi:membrane dipeptidase